MKLEDMTLKQVKEYCGFISKACQFCELFELCDEQFNEAPWRWELEGEVQHEPKND